MKQLSIIMMIGMLLLVGCTTPEATLITPTATLTPTLAPTSKPECHKPGTLVKDTVVFANTGEDHAIAVYLPPCYAENPNESYPVLYWANGDVWWQQLYDSADRITSWGDVPAFINVLIQIKHTMGNGADAQIINDVVPYIDSHYRTQPDRLHRSITGYSNGAAIAIRAAFQAPTVFSRVAVLSGGIANGEQEKFTNWISAMPAGQQPAVMMDVGDQDNVVILTHYLTNLLDKLNYPYTFVHGPGDHSSNYTDEHLENILKWLMAAH